MPDPPRRRRQLRPGPIFRHKTGIKTTAHDLLRLFRDKQILEKAENGQINWRLLSQSHPSPPLADEPECTWSQILGYYENGEKVAEAHRYLRNDGTIGASGFPDPKEIVHEGVLYYLEHPDLG